MKVYDPAQPEDVTRDLVVEIGFDPLSYQWIAKGMGLSAPTFLALAELMAAQVRDAWRTVAERRNAQSEKRRARVDAGPERNSEIANMVRAGGKYAQVGERFGLSAARVKQIADRERRRDEFREVVVSPPTLGTPIEYIGLSPRAYNTLKNEGFRTLGEVDPLTLNQVPNCGKVTIQEISKFVEQANAVSRI